MSSPRGDKSNGSKSRLFRFWQRLVFFFGDFYWLFTNWKEFKETIPLIFGWKEKERKISYNEITKDAMPKLRVGDVILHRDDCVASNLMFGLFSDTAMVHAGIVVKGEDGKADQIVEAISEGVVSRHVINILHSDRACVLRPKFKTRDSKKAALDFVQRVAPKLVGFRYDSLFAFNTKVEWQIVKDAIAKDEKAASLLMTSKHLQKVRDRGDIRLCCVEVPLSIFLDWQEELDLYLIPSKTKFTKLLHFLGLHVGETKFDADMYILANFEIIWCSKEFTVEWAKKQGMNDKYLTKLGEYWSNKNES